MAWLFIFIPVLAVILLNLPFGAGYRKLALGVALTFALAQVAFLLLPVSAMLPFGMCPLCPFTFRSIDALGKLMMISIGIVSFCSLLTGWHLTDSADRKFDWVSTFIRAVEFCSVNECSAIMTFHRLACSWFWSIACL